MPQDNPRSETGRSEQQRSSSARSEQMRGDNAAATEAFTSQMGDMGTRSLNAGLRMQTEMLDTIQSISRDWMTRTTSEAELALNLPNRLAGVRSIPEAISTYQEWLGDWLNKCSEDGRRLVADSQKIVATGVRCFANFSPSESESRRTEAKL
jgi:hypothetical protein